MEFGYGLERYDVSTPGWRFGRNGEKRSDTPSPYSSDFDLMDNFEEFSARGPVFIAEFDSDCEQCGFRIREGQEARMIGSGQAVHDVCPTKRPSCPHCFLVHGTAQEECD